MLLPVCRLAIFSLSVSSLTTSAFSNKLCETVVESKKRGAQLLLLPEFSMAPILNCMNSDTIKATHFLEAEIKKLAIKYNLYICGGSGIYRINDKLYNQSFLVNPEGNIIYQPKINLIESEKVEGFTGGENITIIQTPFAKLAICVCYDIEFPEIVRKIVLEGVDLILNPSYTVDQYGEKRVQYCAQARTIENHIYVAKSCLVGIDGSEVTSIGFGKSALYAPIDYGFCNNGIIAETGQSTVEELLLVDVDFEKLQQLRQKNSTNPLKDYQILKLDSINIKTLNF